MTTIQRFAFPSWAQGGWIPNSERLARLKPIPGKILSSKPKLEASTEASVLATGANFMYDVGTGGVSNNRRMFLLQVDMVIAYSNTIGTLPANWTQTQAENFANNYVAPLGLISDSFDEAYGDAIPYIIADSSPVRGWIDAAFAAKLAAQTPPGVMIANYNNKCQMANLVFGPSIDSSAYRNTLLSKSNARNGLDFFSRAISSTARANFQWYPNGGVSNPIGQWQAYITAYGMLRLRLASDTDKPPLNFSWPSYESPAQPDIWFTGQYAWVHEVADGTLWQNDETWASINQYLEACMISVDMGGGNIVWERPDQFTEDFTQLKSIPKNGTGPDDVWVSQNGSPIPTRTGNGFPSRPLSIYDAPFVAHHWLGEMNERAGIALQFVAHRVNRGGTWSAWREPDVVNDATILSIGQNLHGIARGIESGNNVGFWFTDPSCPLVGQQVEMRLPSGRVLSFDQYGGEPVCGGGVASGTTVSLPRSAAVRLQ